MNSTERRVKGHLPDRDPHASRALIAEPQDSLAVADHDAFHIVVAGLAQDLTDTIFIRIAEKQTSRLSPYLTEALATLADSWRVHQREHLFDIPKQECIEECLVRILQIAEEAVLMKWSGLIPQCLQPARHLFIESPHVRRQ
jgi:hypothetical protein